ncbi:MAG: hypothetical protein KAG97_07115, partial [Victivallales bacterium]|nr:hypothetical protein [Victivallales bacterium]
HLIVAGALLAAVAGTAAIGFLTFNYLNSNGETRTDSSNTKADSNENTDAGYIPPASATAENDSTTATPAQPEEYGPPLPKEVASTTASDSTSSTSSTISQDNADTSAAASNDSADTAESVSADSTPSPMKPTENINASDQETSATSKTAGAASRSPASQDSTSVSSQPADENEKTQTTIVPPSPSSGNTDSGSTKQQTSTKQVSKTTSNDTASNSKQKTESSKPTTPTKIAEASTVGGVQTPVEQKNKPPEVASTETAENSASSGNQNTVEQKKVASKDADPTEKTSSKSTPSNSDTAAKSTTPTPPSTAKDASESASSKKGKAATSGTSPTTPVNGVRNESDGGGNDEDAKNKALEEDFVKFSDNFDLTKNTKLYSGEFWSKASGTEHTWHGKVTYVKGGWWKAEVRVACPNRMLYRGFNAILVTSDKAKAAKLKIGQEITFKGNVYSYKHKWSGLVIIYLKNVKILDGSTTEKP